MVDMFIAPILPLLETEVAGEARPEMTDDEPARWSFSWAPLELEPAVWLLPRTSSIASSSLCAAKPRVESIG
jgi:hypothetical protein